MKLIYAGNWFALGACIYGKKSPDDALVDLGSICDAEILKSNKLEKYIEDTRTYVKGELHKMLDKEVKSNAM